ncbi:MAG: 30S ribosomal protein S19e [Thaumarchaeota archaeon]|jgi:small subunit ribosomal protein S19e|nr:30S ribosomal protein S19e [Nitrososphaerota archaeon]
MPTVYDVPQDLLIKRLAEYLRRLPQVAPPMWAYMVKTGSHAERPPADREWWYTRAASILRKLYLHGPLGLSDLESMYGGRKSVGYSLAHHRDGGGSNIRRILQQLESAGLVAKEGKKGRVLTNKGRSLLDRLSGEIFKELVKVNPELAKYG